MSAVEQLYDVQIDQADDPESKCSYTCSYTWTAAEIGEHLPFLAALFTGDGSESIDYVHELERFRISPIYPEHERMQP